MLGVVLAGGRGHRLWPFSRHQTPKQFSDLLGRGETLLQATGRRVAPLIDPADLWVSTHRDTRHLVSSQMPSIPDNQILAEPSGRNTAPAIAWALTHMRHVDGNETIVILSSDHWVEDASALCRALSLASQLVDDYSLVLLGVEPDHPHTGYGYIQTGPAIEISSRLPAFAVQRFREKPDRDAAQSMLEAGHHLWNCGIVVARLATLRSLFERLAPEMLAAARDPGPDSAAWHRLPALSLDHAIIERADRTAVVPLRTGWTDLGSWEALDRIMDKDGNSNVVMGDHVVAVDSDRNIVCANGRLVTMVGVQDLVIVDTPDALLVGRKDHMQALKSVIENLKQAGHSGVT